MRGASVSTYLLEKSRLTLQCRGERSFHVLYQLLAGATAEERARYELGASTADDYFYTSQSGKVAIDGVDDAREWRATLEACAMVDIDDADIESVKRLLAGLLHLGNVAFKGDEAASVDPGCSSSLAKVCRPPLLRLICRLSRPLWLCCAYCMCVCGMSMLVLVLKVSGHRPAGHSTQRGAVRWLEAAGGARCC